MVSDIPVMEVLILSWRLTMSLSKSCEFTAQFSFRPCSRFSNLEYRMPTFILISDLYISRLNLCTAATNITACG